MGYDVRRKFRTLVLQSEGHMRRMQREFMEASPAAGEFVRFSKPTHLAFGDVSFRAELRRFYESWPFDVIVIDNWSDCVLDDKFADYQQGMDNIRAALPAGDDTPAIVIVAHLSKAVIKSERAMTGRELMAHVSGSFRIGQKARTVFTLVRAWPQEADDDAVIFDCAKANNDRPLPISAWHRCPIEFKPYRDFDIDEWIAPPEDGQYYGAEARERSVRDALGGGRLVTQTRLAEEIATKVGNHPATVQRWIKRLKEEGKIEEVDGEIRWQA
jgi:hypothetical protein